MNTQTILLIGGVAAVGAFFLGWLCKPIGLCPGNPVQRVSQDVKGGASSIANDISARVTGKPSKSVFQGYAYSGYSSAPLTVA